MGRRRARLGVESMELLDGALLHGHILLRTYEDDISLHHLPPYERLAAILAQQEPVAERESHNILCNDGLNVMLSALVWASINDQAANMGGAIAYSDMTPLYGALGTGGVTTIDAASNGNVLPQSTITVASTAGYPTAGQIVISDSIPDTVTYTGITATTFTGCTGGTGTLATAQAVTYVPASTDTALCAEYERAVVIQSGTTAAFSTFNPSFSWLHLLPSSGVSTTITEAGIFVKATGTIADGTPLLDHAMISPAVVQGTTQLITL